MTPEMCMVVEDDENGIVGYAIATLNIKSYNQKMAVSWIPELRIKYPMDSSVNELPGKVQVLYRIVKRWFPFSFFSP